MWRIAACLLALLLVVPDARGESSGEPADGRVVSPPSLTARTTSQPVGSARDLTSSLGPLLLVLGLLAAGAALVKRQGWFAGLATPSGPIQVLARVPLDGRHMLHVVRCGERLLLLGVSPSGVSSLGEIQQPDEVQSLCDQFAPRPVSGLAERLPQVWSWLPIPRGTA